MRAITYLVTKLHHIEVFQAQLEAAAVREAQGIDMGNTASMRTHLQQVAELQAQKEEMQARAAEMITQTVELQTEKADLMAERMIRQNAAERPLPRFKEGRRVELAIGVTVGSVSALGRSPAVPQ